MGKAIVAVGAAFEKTGIENIDEEFEDIIKDTRKIGEKIWKDIEEVLGGKERGNKTIEANATSTSVSTSVLAKQTTPPQVRLF